MSSSTTRSTLVAKEFGGIDRSLPQDKIDDRRSPNCSNVLLEKGILKTRNGYSSLLNSPIVENSQSTKVTGLHVYKKNSGIMYKLFAVGTKMFTHTTILSTIKTGLTTNSWSFVTYQNACFCIQGLTPWKYDGSTFAAVAGSPPTGDRIVHHMERLYVLDAGTDKAYYCDTANPASWPAAGYFYVYPQDNDNIVTGVSRGFELVIFKENHIYEVRGGATPKQIIPIQTGVGAISANSVADSPYGVFFLSKQGPRALDGQTVEEDFAKPVDSLFTANPDRLRNASGVFYNNKYVLAYSDGAVPYNNKVLVYDCVTKEWWPWDNLFIQHFGVYTPNFGADVLFSGDSRNGMIYRNDYTSKDDASDISWFWTSKAFDGGNPGHLKKLRKLMVHAAASGDSIDVGYATSLAGGFNTNPMLLVNDTGLQVDSGQFPSTVAQDNSGEAIWDQGKWDGFLWDVAHTIPSGNPVYSEQETYDVRAARLFRLGGARGYNFKFKLSGTHPASIFSAELEYRTKRKLR